MQIILGLTLSILAGVIPTLIYTAIIWWFDRYEKEPLWLLAVAFLWGAIPAIIVSLVFEIVLGIPVSALGEGLAAEVVSASGIAPLVEESAKAVALLGIFLFFRHEFDGVLDGIIYGALIGFGFAMTENVFYFLASLAEGGWAGWGITVFLRVILFGLNHAFFTSVTGVGLGIARLSRQGWGRWLVPPVALGLATIFHAIHNLGASLAELSCLTIVFSLLADWGGILVVFVVIVLTWQHEKKWIVSELAEEVENGLITPDGYALAASSMRRMSVGWNALFTQGWRRTRQLRRFAHLSTELAFKKHQLRTMGDERGNRETIAKLRDRILALRREMGE